MLIFYIVFTNSVFGVGKYEFSPDLELLFHELASDCYDSMTQYLHNDFLIYKLQILTEIGIDTWWSGFLLRSLYHRMLIALLTDTHKQKILPGSELELYQIYSLWQHSIIWYFSSFWFANKKKISHLSRDLCRMEFICIVTTLSYSIYRFIDTFVYKRVLTWIRTNVSWGLFSFSPFCMKQIYRLPSSFVKI